MAIPCPLSTGLHEVSISRIRKKGNTRRSPPLEQHTVHNEDPVSMLGTAALEGSAVGVLPA
jgi:hypothetical protein